MAKAVGCNPMTTRSLVVRVHPLTMPSKGHVPIKYHLLLIPIMTNTQVPSTLTSLSMPLHPYHMTAVSPWPVLVSAAVLALLSSSALWFNSVDHAGTLTLLGLASVITAASLWFKDVVTEGTHLGLHTRIVQQCLSLGVSLFIVTEVMLFVSVFWAYFLQALEYQQAGFSFGDGAYGSAFYMSTGLHGLHVIVGTLMIVVALSRLVLYHFTEGHHLGLESSILYWHHWCHT